jgi:ABC-type sugar transport system ATPase subunit
MTEDAVTNPLAGATPVGPPLLTLRDIKKAFGPVIALNGVDLDVGFGEVVALVGDNGAGKSTLIKVISGVLPPDGGTISVEGNPVRFSGPDGPKALGIETVYQDLALISVFDTVQNLYVGREMTRFGGLALDHRGMDREANKHLTGLSIRLPSLREKVRHLSGGQRQAVAISRATGWGAKLIIMDEPTAALGVREGRQVLDLVKSLRDSGVSIVLISHNVEHVFEVSERIVVLRHGRRVAALRTKETTHEEVVKFITGAVSAARYLSPSGGSTEPNSNRK